MPAQTFRERDKVQNVRASSEYYGQVGVVHSIQQTTEGVRYIVMWPNGQAMTYRAASLTMAAVPEKSFLTSDSGFRKSGTGTKKITRHTVPSSTRPAIA